MASIKCICPKCGSPLLLWTEYIGYKYEKVLPSGKVMEKKTLPKATIQSDNWGYKCSNSDCDGEWSCTKWGWGGQTFEKEVETIFNKIAEANGKK